MPIQTPELVIADLDIARFYRGIISILRRILVEEAIEEDFPDALRSPKTLVGVAEWKEYKDMDILKDFLFSLFSLGVVKIINDRIQWIGAGIRMLPEERHILEVDPAFAAFFEHFGEHLSDCLKGNKEVIDELVIWDSIESNRVYHDITNYALSLLPQMKFNNVLIVGDRAGWIGEYVYQNLQPSKIVYWVYNQRIKELIFENRFLFTAQNIIDVVVDEYTKQPKIIDSFDLIFIINTLHWLNDDEVRAFLKNISLLMGKNGQLLMIQPNKFGAIYNPLFEVLPKCHPNFKGYPTKENLKEVLTDIGLTITAIKHNLFITAKLQNDSENYKIPLIPPRFCRACGSELTAFQLFCAKCGSIAKDRIILPLI